eukprot:tig00020703_g13135.t1
MSGAQSRVSPTHPAAGTSRIIVRREIDAPDDLDKEWSEQHRIFSELISSCSGETEIVSVLQERVAESPERHREVTMALLYGMIADAAQAPALLRYLTLAVRDGYQACIGQLHRVILEKLPRLTEGARAQVLWLARQLVALDVPDIESVLASLCRQVAGGNVSAPNVALASGLLSLLSEHRAWLAAHPKLVPMVFYTFARVAADHSGSARLLELRQREAIFALQLWRERAGDCAVIGRDLVRVLQDVAKVPEFEEVWASLLGAPAPAGVQQAAVPELEALLATRTPRAFLQSRVTPDMEAHLRFLMSHVRSGQQKRYQAWFAGRYLAGPESDSLVPDLVRFVCGVFHPSNEMLARNLVPRYALIGWLLRAVRTAHAAANVKLALFFDWLHYEPARDNLMNLEPGLLLMVHSLPKYSPSRAPAPPRPAPPRREGAAGGRAALLEFVVLAVEAYDPPRRARIAASVTASFRTLTSRGVLPDLAPLANCDALELLLRDRLRALAPGMCGSDSAAPDAGPAPRRARGGGEAALAGLRGGRGRRGHGDRLGGRGERLGAGEAGRVEPDSVLGVALAQLADATAARQARPAPPARAGRGVTGRRGGGRRRAGAALRPPSSRSSAPSSPWRAARTPAPPRPPPSAPAGGPAGHRERPEAAAAVARALAAAEPPAPASSPDPPQGLHAALFRRCALSQRCILLLRHLQGLEPATGYRFLHHLLASNRLLPAELLPGAGAAAGGGRGAGRARAALQPYEHLVESFGELAPADALARDLAVRPRPAPAPHPPSRPAAGVRGGERGGAVALAAGALEHLPELAVGSAAVAHLGVRGAAGAVGAAGAEFGARPADALSLASAALRLPGLCPSRHGEALAGAAALLRGLSDVPPAATDLLLPSPRPGPAGRRRPRPASHPRPPRRQHPRLLGLGPPRLPPFPPPARPAAPSSAAAKELRQRAERAARLLAALARLAPPAPAPPPPRRPPGAALYAHEEVRRAITRLGLAGAFAPEPDPGPKRPASDRDEPGEGKGAKRAAQGPDEGGEEEGEAGPDDESPGKRRSKRLRKGS